MARYMFSRGWPVIEKQDEITKQRRERKGERDRQTNRERELAVEQANDQVSPPCHPPPPLLFFCPLARSRKVARGVLFCK